MRKSRAHAVSLYTLYYRNDRGNFAAGKNIHEIYRKAEKEILGLITAIELNSGFIL